MASASSCKNRISGVARFSMASPFLSPSDSGTSGQVATLKSRSTLPSFSMPSLGMRAMAVCGARSCVGLRS